jgi:hypothetical protein
MDCKVKLNFFESKLRAKINQYQQIKCKFKHFLSFQ